MLGSQTNEIIEEIFNSLLQKYQNGLEESMKGREFLSDYVDLLYQKFHQISIKRVESFIDSPKWLKDKKATRNPKIKNDKSFQYDVTVALS